MVETRMQDLENNIKACDERIKDLARGQENIHQAFRTEMGELKDSMGKDLADIRLMLSSLQKTTMAKDKNIIDGLGGSNSNSNSILGKPVGFEEGPDGNLNAKFVAHGVNVLDSYKKHVKLYFPRFNGEDHRGWIRKCHRFFKFRAVPEEDRVELATMHFDGSVEFWLQNYQKEIDSLPWDRFRHQVAKRFGAQAYENIEGEFAKLQQSGTVAEYQDRFEELMALLKAENPGLSEKYFVNNFIGGLKEDIRYMVQCTTC